MAWGFFALFTLMERRHLHIKPYISEYIHAEIYKCIRDENYYSTLIYSLFSNISIDQICSIIKEYWINQKSLLKILYRHVDISNHFCLRLPEVSPTDTFNLRV